MEDTLACKIAIALTRSLNSRPELLPYLRDKILDEFKKQLENVTDEDVKEFIGDAKEEDKEQTEGKS